MSLAGHQWWCAGNLADPRVLALRASNASEARPLGDSRFARGAPCPERGTRVA